MQKCSQAFSDVTIAAVLIVRDEESTLAPCLESLSGVVDEIVVLDTGSIDGTVALARRYTDAVHRVEWTDDFAAARNAALEFAQADWVLQLDADERVEGPSNARDLLEDFIRREPETTLGLVQLRGALWSPSGPQESVAPLHRFFHRRRFRYKGAIHERLVPIDGAAREAPTGLRLYHVGYARDPEANRPKHERNLRLLETALERDPRDARLRYHYGIALNAMQRYAEAAGALEACLAAITFREDGAARYPSGAIVPPEILVDLLVTLAYAYVNTNRVEKARALLEYHLDLGHIATQFADFHHALGYVHLMLGNVPRARAAYLESLRLGADCELIRGTGGYASRYHLGLLHEAEGNLAAAAAEYAESVREKSDYAPVVRRLADLVVEYRPLSLGAFTETVVGSTLAGELRRRLDRAESENNKTLVGHIHGIIMALGPGVGP